jgi:DNA primase
MFDIDMLRISGTHLLLNHLNGKSQRRRRLKLLCIFHEEKTPSLIIDFNEMSYHCFGCGKSGTVELSTDGEYLFR